MPGPVPLVTIAIPAGQDAAALDRSVRSALAQDHADLGVLIVADSPAVEAACAGLSAEDGRISVLRPAQPPGAIESRQLARDAAKSEYFMWLAAGDWLDPDFVSTCVGALRIRQDHVAAAGRNLFHDESGTPQEVPALTVAADQGAERVEEMLGSAIDAGTYWLFRRAAIADIPLRRALGYEFGLLAEAAFRGKFLSLPSTASHRQGNPNLESFSELAAKLGTSPYQAEDPYLTVAAILFCDIAFLRPAYQRLPEGERLRLATRAVAIVARRWTILNALQFMAYASRIFAQERIGERVRRLRRSFAIFLMTGQGDGYGGLPTSTLVETINLLCRIGLGKMPPAKDEVETLARLGGAWEAATTDDRRNRLLMAMALYV